MLKSMTFRSTLAAVACALSFCAHALADPPRQVNIPAGDLIPALEILQKQAAIELVFQPDQLKSFRTKGVTGSYEPKDAVRLLLKGTPLQLRTDPTGAMVIALAGARTTAAASATAAQAGTGSADSSQSRSSLQLAQATPGSASGAAPVAAQSTGSQANARSDVLEEVIVTAQKREERLQDVPIPMSVISADTLAQTNQVRVQDYFSTVPGLNVSPAGGNEAIQTLTIRGLSSGYFTNPTVGTTVDDVPFGSSIDFGGTTLPDFDPSDLARVEVLRGPQGTLYGASSMGGLLKFVTVDPSTTEVSGRVQADVNTVENGSQPGYAFRGAINVPLGDTLAVRASAFTRQDAGYVDNPTVTPPINGVNEDRVSGGRISALWKPSEDFSVKLSALYQEMKADGVSEVTVPTPGFPQSYGLGDLQQNYVRDCCSYVRALEAYSAVINWKLSDVTLTSVTGYNSNRYNTGFDFSYALTGFAQLFFPAATGATENTNSRTDKFSQEIRADIPFGKTFDWLVAAFYTHENTPFYESIWAADHDTGSLLGYLGSADVPNKYTEYAAFTDLTIHFTDRFTTQIGARESHIEQLSLPATEDGPLFGGGTSVLPEVDVSSNVFTYLLSPQFKFSEDLMAYARIASGYRPGASNNFVLDPAIPRAANPDKTQSYELGVKGDGLNHTLTFDASVYYINWQDIQIQLADQNGVYHGVLYTTNGGRAKSEGVELSVEAKPLRGLDIGAWIAYNNADLIDGMPANSSVEGPPGTQLPYGSRWSGNLSANQTFPLTGDLTGFVGGNVSYVGERLGTFVPVGSTLPRAYFPEYVKTDVRAGGTYKNVTATLYANNVTDKRGVLGGGIDPSYAYYYLQPRTVGLSVTLKF
jgi:iron complex outermembrane recepter protein